MRLPFLIFLLGIAGLVPFVFLGGSIFIGHLFAPQPRLMLALLAYGACILSFLGAVHWGLAMERPDIINDRTTSDLDRWRLIFGVCPAVLAWLALYIGMVANPRTGLSLEILGFVAVYIFEKSGWKKGAIPQGYIRLRLALTIGVVISLLLAILGT
ncbi:hypothetical protein AA106555_0037 [Neokomagataea thailandica NBRC 106555]|uniref:DUF3429 domain-containing protein n=2 Tax=Neokomagataea TaxID=1223423 RepID=A0A4Y6V9K8_9PROT|nr:MULTISPECIES: DUF3429 domain-containing protein [Neokomagataea]QDH25608.1 DUF3429 domain-containing protein [Neokomagataea tanensis]GBR49950.1 hypothetical protein AA106555_0037 [Neokomagataea thailandica NBRC 106555]